MRSSNDCGIERRNIRHRSEKRTIAIALQRLDRLIRKRLPLLLERLEPRFVVGEAELQAQ